MAHINIGLTKKNSIVLISIILSLFFYWLFAYDLIRDEHNKLFIYYTVLFALFLLIYKYSENNKLLLGVSILYRILFLLAIPNLSQDFYRFIWDGRMIIEGYNPYLQTPISFIESNIFPVNQSEILYQNMGSLSAGNHTNYPPINQLCFVIAGLFAGKSILGSTIIMRLLIIIADFGTFYFGSKLLSQLNIPVKRIFIYLLNPFIIIELTGNIHFESVMIFFLIWSLYLLYKRKWLWSAIIFALSVSVKLIPLLFLPLFFKWFINTKELTKKSVLPSVKKLILFYLVIIGVNVLLFLPFLSNTFIQNYTQTVGLWFQNFEFNASIYYLARELGYLFRGYNEIAIIGKILPIIVIAFVLTLTFLGRIKSFRDLITMLLFSLTCYYLLSTTVHPWYIATLVILSIFTTYKYPLVWSYIVIISYLAYSKTATKENSWILFIEYAIVFSAIIYDYFVWTKSKQTLTES